VAEPDRVAKPEKHSITSIHPVGRYALGVSWGDKHDSIYPFGSLRRLCPCADCRRAEAAKREPGDRERALQSVQRLRDASLMLQWTDGHETLFLVEELRAICGCAACKGEPEYPITGQ
jgi:DUF971 family protein